MNSNASKDVVASASAYANKNAYGDNHAYRGHDAYGGADPYAKKDDPYAKKDTEQVERRRPWALDFEIIRFFREHYNAGIDFEESPRIFFDEEYMLGFRIKLMGRNFTTLLFKFIFMLLFAVGALFLHGKALLIVGMAYFISFSYFIIVPVAFVKYARQYVIDNTEKGKLNKIHKTYSKWVKPLEVIAMNTYSVIFIILESVMFFNSQTVLAFMQKSIETIKIKPIVEYVDSITITDIHISIAYSIFFFVAAYLFYWAFIYKYWSPKWEKQRAENERQWTRTNQRVAKNLKDEFTKSEED